jgi:protein O-GlcNAc transferase
MNDDAWRERLRAAADDHRAGRLDAAETVYRSVLAQVPAQADTLHLLGVLCHQRGRDGEAIELIGRAIEVEPAIVDFHNNLGVSLAALRRLVEAEMAFRRALAVKPGYAAALCNLGDVLLRQGRIAEALEVHARAVATEPGNPVFHYNLGIARKERGDFKGAIAAYERALALRPDYGDAHNNLGVALYELGRMAEAEAAYARALGLRPDNAQAHYNLGKLHHLQGRFADAVTSCRTALALRPDFPAAHDNLLMALTYDPTTSAGALAEAHRAFGRAYDRPAAAIAPFPNVRDYDRRLRIGYMSPDFRRHSCAHFSAPLIEAHDRAGFELFAYAELARADATTERFKAAVDHWRETAWRSDDEVERMVRDDRIDILVDLAGHTADNRLPVFARKPAPVQATWLGYPGTTGLRTIDYRLTDAVADPPGTEAEATEKLVHLPRGFLCFEAPADAPAVSPLPARSAPVVTFGSFNNAIKINDAVARLWAAVLRTVPRSRLLIKAFQIDHGDNRRRLETVFAAAGVEPGRVDIRPPYDQSRSHLATYGELDIALDPFPYNGTTTSCETLWMGVPIIALRGDRHAARVGASLLTAVGVPELIAESPADYVAKAAALAADLDRLATLRAGLRERMRASPLADPAGFARQVEAAYREMWRGWCDGGR